VIWISVGSFLFQLTSNKTRYVIALLSDWKQTFKLQSLSTHTHTPEFSIRFQFGNIMVYLLLMWLWHFIGVIRSLNQRNNSLVMVMNWDASSHSIRNVLHHKDTIISNLQMKLCLNKKSFGVKSLALHLLQTYEEDSDKLRDAKPVNQITLIFYQLVIAQLFSNVECLHQLHPHEWQAIMKKDQR